MPPDVKLNSAKSVEDLRSEMERCVQELGKCRQSLEELNGVFAHVADGIFVADQSGRIVNANPAASTILGYSHEELLAMHPWDFVVNASREEILGLIKNMTTGSPVTIQRIYRSKSGENKVVDLRMTRCQLAGSDLVVVSCRDITEQKLLEDRLRRSESNLAEGQRLTKTGSWILDYQTGNTDWSVETCRIFGFPDPPPSPHYREFRARVRPEDRDAVDRGLKESFETGEPRPLKYIFVLPNGTRKNIETISQPVRDESGKVVRLMGTVMDVTERKQAEDAIRASEKWARGQAESLSKTLDALARESAPDRIVEHVLRTITNQLDAHSCSIWLREAGSGLMTFEFALEGAAFKTKTDAFLASVSPSMKIEEVWPWPEVFQTGKPTVMEDIRQGVEFPWRAHVLAQGIITILIVPMLIANQVQGVIGIRFTEKRVFRAEEMELAQALSHQAMLAIQLNRLSAQSRKTAVLAERNRLARDMHDTLAQGFTGVIMQLEAAKGAVAKQDAEAVAAHIERASNLARTSLGEARRSVHALRPLSLMGGTLCAALDDLLKRMTSGTKLLAEFVVAGENRVMPADWEEDLLRITQESLTNTIKYAQASRFNAKLSFLTDCVELQLVDDGQGFDARAEHDGFGLVGIKERVNRMAGQFVIRSKPGQGVEIVITLNQPQAVNTSNENHQA